MQYLLLREAKGKIVITKYKRILNSTVLITGLVIGLLLAGFAQAAANTRCQGDDAQKWNNCIATIKNNDGSAYEGDIANGQIHGYGILTLPTGEKVLGQFKNSVLTGRGLFVGNDGSRYAGDFDQNNFNGQGIYVAANGERQEGLFKAGQLAEAKKVTDAQILALLSAAPTFSSLAVLTGKTAGGETAPTAEMKTYDAGKIYYFQKGLGGPRGTCVSTKWGEGYQRNVGDGIPYWGMKLYSFFSGAKREPGFFVGHSAYDRFEGTTVPLSIEKANAERLRQCDYVIATGEELNALPVLNQVLHEANTEFKLKHTLTLADAEKEWLNARGFTSRADYDNAATMNWEMSGLSYASLSKFGVTNMDQFNEAKKRREAIQCGEGYSNYLEGMIDFLTDEQAARKAKAPMDKYCAKRVTKARQEQAKEQEAQRREELASPLLNCTKVNCTSGASVESAVRDSWMRLRAQNHPFADNCFDAIKLVKDLREAGRIFGPDTVTTAFFMCNRGLKELR